MKKNNLLIAGAAVVALGSFVVAPGVQAATSTGKVSLLEGDATKPTAPIEPGDGGGETGQVGVLTIDNATPLNFGSVALTGNGQTLKNTAKAPNVQVTDKRGTGAGWNVTVKSSEFKDATTPTHTLKGAVISFPAGTATSSDATNVAKPVTSDLKVNADGTSGAQVIMTAGKDLGLGTWADIMPADGVTLDIAGGAYVGEYTAQLTWTLADTPA